MKYIYLANIEGTDIYKIGFTKKNPKVRISSLQTGNPFKILLVDFVEIEDASQVESILHRNLKTKKYISEEGMNLLGEWFKLEVDDIKGFKDKCKRIQENLNFLRESSTLYSKKNPLF